MADSLLALMIHFGRGSARVPRAEIYTLSPTDRLKAHLKLLPMTVLSRFTLSKFGITVDWQWNGFTDFFNIVNISMAVSI